MRLTPAQTILHFTDATGNLQLEVALLKRLWHVRVLVVHASVRDIVLGFQCLLSIDRANIVYFEAYNISFLFSHAVKYGDQWRYILPSRSRATVVLSQELYCCTQLRPLYGEDFTYLELLAWH